MANGYWIREERLREKGFLKLDGHVPVAPVGFFYAARDLSLELICTGVLNGGDIKFSGVEGS
jgi:hypothetical protein